MLNNFRKSLMAMLMASIVAGCVLTAAIVGGGAYFAATGPIHEQARRDVAGPLDLRTRRLSEYAASIVEDLVLLTNLESVSGGVMTLTSAFTDTTGATSANSVFKAFVKDNPHPLGQRDKYLGPDDGSAYAQTHKDIHPELRALLYARGYYDIFLINPEGTIVYTVVKEDDFTTNLLTGSFRNSGLADTFARALKLSEGEAAFADFAPYGPSGSAPASFVAMPIFSAAGDGAPVGVVAAQVMPEALERAIMAETPESNVQSYLIGSDGLLRTDFMASDLDAALETRLVLENEALLPGNTAIDARGLLGEEVLLAARPVNFLGADWFLVTQANKSIALSSVTMFRTNILLLLIPSAAIVALGAWITARMIVAPIQRIDTAMTSLGNGDFTVTVPETNRPDEIGSVARSTDSFRLNLLESKKRRDEQKNFERQNAAEKQEMMRQLEEEVVSVVGAMSDGELSKRIDAEFSDPATQNLANGVNAICNTISDFADQLESSMSAVADGDLTKKPHGDFKGRFADVCLAVENSIEVMAGIVAKLENTGTKMANSVKSVSDGARDLAGRAETQSASLQESAATMEDIANAISQNAENTKKVTSLASDTTEKATQGRKVVSDAVAAMSAIEDSSVRISETTSTIDAIAFQTNLLALNAAVEAARAGDSGKGFAVVASEVRTLAQRSAAAARDITDLIESSSSKVSEGVRLVNATGNALSAIVDAISSLSATIGEISNASREQSEGVAEITSAVSNMDSMTQMNAGLADSSASAATQLEEMTAQLTEIIAFFQVNQPTKAAVGTENADVGRSDLPLPESQEEMLDAEWKAVETQASTDDSGSDEAEGFDPASGRRAAANGEEWADF